jgi:hypothetical protein
MKLLDAQPAGDERRGWGAAAINGQAGCSESFGRYTAGNLDSGCLETIRIQYAKLC